MSTPTEEMVVDLDAADKKAAEKQKNTDKGASTDPKVVIDPEVSAAAAAKEIITPDQGIEKLKNQLAESERARLAAEARAADAARGEADARGAAQNAQLEQIKGAIEQTTQQVTVAKREYAAAAAAADWEAAAEAQNKMSRANARLEHLEAGKIALEKAPPPKPRAPADPVEAFCAQLTPQSAAWVRAHPEFVTDKQKHAQMVAAHELAIARGHKADTPGYFKQVERILEIGPATIHPAHTDDPAAPGAEVEDDAGEVAAQAAAKPAGGRQSSPPAAAPVTRGNGAGRANTVRLTAEEVEMAQACGQTPEEYARNKLALKKEGKMS